MDSLICSNSEIQTFKRCRRRWWLQYILKLVPIRPEKSGPAAIGTRIHTCVAYYYDLQVAGFDGVLLGEYGWSNDPLEMHDDLVQIDIDEWPDQEEDILKDADLSRAMLEGYFEWLEETGADDGIKPIAVEEEIEQEIETPLTCTPVRIRAKLDLRVECEGVNGEPEPMFLDHKSVQEFKTPTRTLTLDEQMLLYDWLLRWRDDFAVGAIYNMLRKVKRTARANPPFFQRFTVRHSTQELRAFHNRLMGELEEMIRCRAALERGEDHQIVAYPSPNRNCGWDCVFFDVCNLFNRPDEDPFGYVKRLFAEGDPYERYTDLKGMVE
jgi:hypothetical protein